MPILGIMASQISGHLFAPSGAYDSIATTTVSSNVSTITFSSIPATYKHLQIRIFGLMTGNNGTLMLRYNSDSGANYSVHNLYGSGAAVAADATANSTYAFANTTGNPQAAVSIVDILDYTDTNKYKTNKSLIGLDHNGSGYLYLSSGNWRNTAAISTIELIVSTFVFTQYSQAALYGIKGAQTMAAGNTYVALATQTLTGNAATVTFSSISGAYTDLVLIGSATSSSGAGEIGIQFNGDTGSNYSSTYMYGNGTAATSGRSINYTQIYLERNATVRTTTRPMFRANIMNYSNTTTYKTVLTRADSASESVDAVVGLWRSTAAITSILIDGAGATFAIGSTFTLYGILAAQTMAANYVLLAKISVGAAGASSVTFSGIPQTGYTDLVVKASARTGTSGEWGTLNAQFNGSTTTYSGVQLYGTGSAAGSSSSASWGTNLIIVGRPTGATATANTFGNSEFCIPNYTSANYKSVSSDGVTENNATAALAAFVAGLWSNTAAITSIKIFDADTAGDIKQYSTFYLYGVAALGTTPVIVPYATGGDTIMTDGTYWYHAFNASGTFTPAKGLSCDALVVAGGGGGGCTMGGGAGAGGLVYSSSQSLTAQAYTVTVGAGGAGSTTSAAKGTSGVNSNVTGGSLSLTAAVGGGGGGSNDSVGASTITPGANGGSGGGGAGSAQSTNRGGGTATSGQGSGGGTGFNTAPNYGAGGGGGFSATGANGTGSTGGNGGVGTATYTTFGSVTGTGQNVSGTYYYAGGGGGGTYNGGTAGTGGSGGGGAGATSSAGTAGTANTGGAGGGGGDGGNGGTGGSGIIIVRYAV